MGANDEFAAIAGNTSKRKLTAILHADVAGYSRLMGEDEAGTHGQLMACRRLIDRFISHHDGRLVGTAGDAVLADFVSVHQALRAAIAIQRHLAEQNTETPKGQRLEFRVGINIGDVIVEDDDIFGNGVNVAARVQALADPGGIAISGAAFDQIKDTLGTLFRSLGRHRVKNIAEAIRVYAIDPAAICNLDPPRQKRVTKARLWISATAVLLAASALAGLANQFDWRSEEAVSEDEQRTDAANQLTRTDPIPGIQSFRDCSYCPLMQVMPTGAFAMGSPDNEAGRDNDEGPVHEVAVATFAIGAFEVSRGEFARFVSSTNHRAEGSCWFWNGDEWEQDPAGSWREPGFAQSDNDPVTCVNWHDAVDYTHWLSETTGVQYRLPSEAEWEYAARAGTVTSRFWGDVPADGCAFANGADQSVRERYPDVTFATCTDGYVHTAPVGSFAPNAFGLHDTLGNVWEWTADCSNPDYRDAPLDGAAWELGQCSHRILRGGAWNDRPRHMRSADRYTLISLFRSRNLGFRVARSY